VILQPFSPFAEVIRGLRTRLNRSREGRPDANVIGFVSAMPGEGKSTVSANFAFFLAQAGMRTLLVDADLRRHTLSRLIAPQALSGIAEITTGTSSIEQAVWREPISGLAFLPSAAASVQAHGPDASIAGFGGPLTSALLLSLREQFDMIVVDLPAMSPVADAAVATSVMSGVVMVVEWGETSFEVVQECLENAGIAPQRLLGVVLNKARPEMRRYDQGKLGTVPASPSRVTA
jgi:succinoglycan biosynthesis transport protein ExoP